MITVDIATLRQMADKAEQRLRDFVAAQCPGTHRPMQHRDARPPWCQACRRTERGESIDGDFDV